MQNSGYEGKAGQQGKAQHTRLQSMQKHWVKTMLSKIIFYIATKE